MNQSTTVRNNSPGKFKKIKRFKRKRIKKHVNNLNQFSSYHHNPYQYVPHQLKQPSNEYINFKLGDLFKPNRTLIDNLYAQIHSNSNKISLLYVPNYSNYSPMNEQILYNDQYRKLNIVPLTSQSDSNYSVNTNKLINEFYLSATNLENKIPRSYSNTVESVRMPRLLTSEIFLIGFVISLWLISILICLKRYSLFICFHKRDVPFYNSSLINVSTKIVTEEFSNTNTSRPMSPVNHNHHHQWNPVENEPFKEAECSACSKSPSTNATLNKSSTQTTNFNAILNYEQNLCKKCNKIKNLDKSHSNGYFNSKSSNSVNKIHKNFSFNSNKVNLRSVEGKNEYYFSNGILYPIKKNSSTMLHKVCSKSNRTDSQKTQSKPKESLASKRAVIRNKHFNLMSLDENVLYKLNRISYLNSTIHESSIDAADNEIKEQKNEKKLCLLANTVLHSNFISLRSGSESANSSCIKPGRSYDNDNCDCNDVDSSSSLQQSQFLKPPSLSKLNSTVLPTSQRPINPISNLRRHMFVNSRRSAQTTFDKYANDSLFTNDPSVDFCNSMSIASNNLSNIPAIVDEPSRDSNVNVNFKEDQKVEVVNECKDPNLLNPSWIPLIVRRTLLEMHERAVLSKSDSNIKSKYRSSNHLLHSSTSYKNNHTKAKSNRKKKSLSLQNSQDKSNFYSTSSSNNRSSGSNYLNSFYEELRHKFFQANDSKYANIDKSGSGNQNVAVDKMKSSTSNSNTMSTDVSTAAFKLDSKLSSLDQQNPGINNFDMCLNEDEENIAEANEKKNCQK